MFRTPALRRQGDCQKCGVIAAALLVILPWAASCTGVVSAPSVGGSSGSGGVAGAAGNAGPAACEETGVAPVRAWKLTRAQYLATVAQFTDGAEVNVAIPSDGIIGGFNTSDANEVTPLHAEAFSDYAEAAAIIAATKAASRISCLAGNGSPNDDCVASFVTSVARKAYRRPIAAEEATRYAAFFRKAEQAYGKADAIKMTYEGALQSPWFLFRWEVGEHADAGGKVALTPHELASELSYLIADAPPSAELLAAADDGSIMEPAVRAEFARLLLDEPAARAKLARFFSAYLHLDNLEDPNRTKDPVTFPMFNSELKREMVAATHAFVDHEIWQEKGSILSLFTAAYAYVSPKLAEVYGLEAPTTAGLHKLTMDPERRAGLLTQPGVIAALSSQKTTSPVHRGLFFARTLLCLDPPPPLADVESQALGTLISPDAMSTQREHWEFAQTVAEARTCVSCHVSFQPYGLSMETYDAIGQYRTEEFGKPLDTSGEVVEVDPEVDGPYADAPELARKIMSSRVGQTCFVSQVSTYLFGRKLDDPADASCATQRTVDRFREGKLSPQELLIALTQDQHFTHRVRSE